MTNPICPRLKLPSSVCESPLNTLTFLAKQMGAQRDSSLQPKQLSTFQVIVFAVICVLMPPAHSQPDHLMTPIATPNQPTAIKLGTPELPGATAEEVWHTQYGSRFARNVTVATLTPFFPDPAKASGTAIIVAPGGGFRTLSMENEGWNVAHALAEQGIAAFVLKYRLNQTPEDMAEFKRSMEKMFSDTSRRPPGLQPKKMKSQLAVQLEDSQAAFDLIRSHAAEWKIDPDRIGMIGFSAGGMLTLATAVVGETANPAFIGDIYGPLHSVTVPANAPPLFVALAADDPLFPETDFGLIKSWRTANKPVEFHYYEQGGHGFGMYPKETTSTGWFNTFIDWLTMHGMLKHKA